MTTRALLLTLSMAVVGGGCYRPPPEGLRADAKRGARVVPTLGDPIPVGNTMYLAFPFAVQVDDEAKSKVGLASSSFGLNLDYYGSSYAENPGVPSAPSGGWVGGNGLHWNNVLFLHRESGASHLLFDRKVVITAAYLPATGDASRTSSLFAVADADTNGDKFINDEDSVVLFHASPDGRAPTPVTPPGAQFRWFVTDPMSQTIWARVRRDTDGNKRFSAADETQFLTVNLAAPAQGTPMLPPDAVRQAFETVSPAE